MLTQLLYIALYNMYCSDLRLHFGEHDLTRLVRRRVAWWLTSKATLTARYQYTRTKTQDVESFGSLYVTSLVLWPRVSKCGVRKWVRDSE